MTKAFYGSLTSIWWGLRSTAVTVGAYLALSLIGASLLRDAVITTVCVNLVTIGSVWWIIRRQSISVTLPALPRERTWWGTLAVSVVLTLFTGQILGVWLYHLGFTAGFDAVQTAEQSSNVVLTLALVMLIAPAAEELLIRRCLYTLLRRRWTLWASAITSAAIFALLHGNVVQAVLAFPLGVLTAVVYERTQRIMFCIAIHVVFNSMAVVLPVAVVVAVANPIAIAFAVACGYSIWMLQPRPMLYPSPSTMK